MVASPSMLRWCRLPFKGHAHSHQLMPAGMKIRFANLIKGLRQLGDDVMVVTPCINPPKTFHGAKVLQRPAHQCPLRCIFDYSCAMISLTCFLHVTLSQKSVVPAQVVNVLGFSLPFYRSPTLLLSLGLSVRVLYFLITQRPDVIHVSSPGLLVFAATLYAKLLAIPLVVSCTGLSELILLGSGVCPC